MNNQEPAQGTSAPAPQPILEIPPAALASFFSVVSFIVSFIFFGIIWEWFGRNRRGIESFAMNEIAVALFLAGILFLILYQLTKIAKAFEKCGCDKQ